MSQADSRQLVKSILSNMKELFRNSTRGARERAWSKFYSTKGNEAVRKLINNPSLQINHFDNFLTFKEWLEKGK
jgi:hypothetical protein